MTKKKNENENTNIKPQIFALDNNITGIVIAGGILNISCWADGDYKKLQAIKEKVTNHLIKQNLLLLFERVDFMDTSF